MQGGREEEAGAPPNLNFKPCPSSGCAKGPINWLLTLQTRPVQHVHPSSFGLTNKTFLPSRLVSRLSFAELSRRAGKR